MAAKKGQGKTPGSGRKKGTPNKRTLDLQARMEELGCDPIDFMVKVIKGEIVEDVVLGTHKGEPIIRKMAPGYDLQVACAKELAQYLYPKRKALELTGGDGEELSLVLVDSTTLPGWKSDPRNPANQGKKR